MVSVNSHPGRETLERWRADRPANAYTANPNLERTLTVLAGVQRVPIEDAAAIAPALRGYVQLALDQGMINARFEVSQGPFDLQPTLRAFFDPGTAVTRAAFAAAATRTLGVYGP